MKKLPFVFLVAIAAQTGNAQTVIKAGTVSIGGSIGYGQQHTENTDNLGSKTVMNQKTFSAGPSVGYFVADNVAIGLSVGYDGMNNSATHRYPTPTPGYFSNGFNSRQVSVGAFAQYYHLITAQFGVVGTFQTRYGRFDGEGDAQANRSNASIPQLYSSSSTGHTMDAVLIPSLLFLPIPKLGIGASFGSLGYNYSETSAKRSSSGPDANFYPSDESGKASGFGANFGLSFLSLSGTYYLGR